MSYRMKKLLTVLMALAFMGAFVACAEDLIVEAEPPETELEIVDDAPVTALDSDMMLGEDLSGVLNDALQLDAGDAVEAAPDAENAVRSNDDFYIQGAPIVVPVGHRVEVTARFSASYSDVKWTVEDEAVAVPEAAYTYSYDKNSQCYVVAKAVGATRIIAQGDDGQTCSAELKVVADDYLAIDAAHFPDASLREALQENFADCYWPVEGAYADGALSVAAIDYVTRLDCLNGKDIKSLKGIEVFTELISLDFSYSEVDSFDATVFPKLQYLYCEGNDMTSLKVSGLSELDTLDCSANNLKMLDLTGCGKLKGLNCGYNALTALDASPCPNLVELLCSGNSALASVNISGCEILIRCFEQGTRKGSESTYYEFTIATDLYYDYHLRVDPTSKIVYGGASHSPAPAEESVVGKVVEIGDKAFYNNKKLTTVTIGKNVKTIGKSAFAGCAKLKTVKGGAAVTSVKSSAFKDCKALTAITLNKNVEKIGTSAFYGCAKLKTVTIKSSKLKSVGKNAFKGVASKATFKCPKKKLAAYKKLISGAGAPKNAKYV